MRQLLIGLLLVSAFANAQATIYDCIVGDLMNEPSLSIAVNGTLVSINNKGPYTCEVESSIIRKVIEGINVESDSLKVVCPDELRLYIAESISYDSDGKIQINDDMFTGMIQTKLLEEPTNTFCEIKPLD